LSHPTQKTALFKPAAYMTRNDSHKIKISIANDKEMSIEWFEVAILDGYFPTFSATKTPKHWEFGDFLSVEQSRK
jgi:hypothetical protein